MNWGKTLAEVNIVLNSGVAIGYVFAGDMRRALYWLFAAAITATVTF